MTGKSKNREQELQHRKLQVQKKIITVENDRLDKLPTSEKLKLLKEIQDMGDWRGLYEELYVAMAEDADTEVRRLATAAFWDFPDEEYLDDLLDKALYDEDETVCAEACSVLGRFIYEGWVADDFQRDYKEVKQFLLDFVRDESNPPMARQRALESLSFDTDDEITELIAEAYKEKGLDWKAAALFSMGRSHLERWHKTIIKELDSKSRRIRFAAVAACREGYVSSATPKLAKFAFGDDPDLRPLAVAALPYTGGETALETLEACTLDRDMRIVEASEAALDLLFGLDDEQSSEIDLVDVRLGTVSDIEIIDASKVKAEVLKSDESLTTEEEGEEEEEEEESEEEENEEEEAIPLEDDEGPEEVAEEIE